MRESEAPIEIEEAVAQIRNALGRARSRTTVVGVDALNRIFTEYEEIAWMRQELEKRYKEK